ncbi:MAG: ComF family protein [Ruminococcus sp.]|nr:ComF family protein [Ruminococcus sp.]
MTERSMIYKYLINIVFPNVCPICGKIIEWDELLCADCIEKLPYNDDKLCSVCGKRRCREHSLITFDGVYTLVRYEEPVISAIYELKNGESLNLSEFAALKLAAEIKKDGIADKIDIVTSVPMNWRKKSDKGINHADKTAGFMAAELKKPLGLFLLKKRRDKTVQHKLAPEERMSHANDVFRISNKHIDIKGKSVLICDDVYTTGATFNRCASLLKQMGADKVYCMAIANTELDEKG